MLPLSSDILKNYQVRKTNKQKESFIRLMQSHYPNLQIQTGGLMKSRNLILGNIKDAEFILTAHYDTCAQIPFPNFITPKNTLFYICYSLMIFIPIFILMVLFDILINHLTSNFWVAYFANFLLYFLLCFVLLAGPPNKHTANDNTSGVITLCELYESLAPHERDRVCIVFFDNEENGLLGSRVFKKAYKKDMESKLLINFDCVSDGDYILVAATASARKQWNVFEHFASDGSKKALCEKAEKVFYPSDQHGFKNSVAIAALKHKKVIGYYMDRIHTSRDTVFDEANIQYLCKSMTSFISANVPSPANIQ